MPGWMQRVPHSFLIYIRERECPNNNNDDDLPVSTCKREDVGFVLVRLCMPTSPLST